MSVNGQAPPPLHLWEPDYCGEIDMVIKKDGTWVHDGVPIKRKEIWQLFAGILRREDCGEYFLVTPVEKCLVKVELHPLIIIDINSEVIDGKESLFASLNSGGDVRISRRYPIELEPRAGGAAFIVLDNGLTALCSRATWYRLVAQSEEDCTVTSAGIRFPLLPQ